MNRNTQIIVQKHKALEERVSNIWEWDCNDNDAITFNIKFKDKKSILRIILNSNKKVSYYNYI